MNSTQQTVLLSWKLFHPSLCPSFGTLYIFHILVTFRLVNPTQFYYHCTRTRPFHSNIFEWRRHSLINFILSCSLKWEKLQRWHEQCGGERITVISPTTVVVLSFNLGWRMLNGVFVFHQYSLSTKMLIFSIWMENLFKTYLKLRLLSGSNFE